MQKQQKLLYTLVLTGVWTSLFAVINYSVRINHISKSKQDDIKNRIISIVHGLLSFWLCSIALLIQPDLLNNTNSHTTNILLINSLSYFIYDTFACFYYKLFDKTTVIHHLVCIISLFMVLLKAKGSFYPIVGLSVSEISNFPMHFRLILKNIGLRYTKMYQISENIFLYFYILARGIVSPIFISIPGLVNNNLSVTLKLTMIILQVLSFYFIYDMIGIIRKNHKNRLEMEEKNIDYDWFSVDRQKVSKLSFYKESQEIKTQ